MTQKELGKLSRKRLLEMLAEQTGRADRLQRENDRLKERISDREQHLAQMGTLAQAILHSDSSMAQETRDSIRESLKEISESNKAAGDEEAGEEEEKPPGTITDWPTREQLLLEAQRAGGRGWYIWSLKTAVYTMITVAAVTGLVAVLVLPVMQIYGASMSPTLYDGDIVVSVKGGKMDTGDLAAFYYNNKILVGRVIGRAGQWVDIAEDGTVYVDNVEIDEPYLTEKVRGECEIELPYQVPENRVFVLGDNRSVAVDSRSRIVGCVAVEQVVGKIVFRVWPLNKFGNV